MSKNANVAFSKRNVTQKEKSMCDHKKRPKNRATTDTATPAPRVTRTAPAPLAVDDEEEPLDVEVDVPLSCFASETNASKLFAPDSTALAAKTMPDPQWFA